jgi:hypothetical protein
MAIASVGCVVLVVAHRREKRTAIFGMVAARRKPWLLRATLASLPVSCVIANKLRLSAAPPTKDRLLWKDCQEHQRPGFRAMGARLEARRHRKRTRNRAVFLGAAVPSRLMGITGNGWFVPFFPAAGKLLAVDPAGCIRCGVEDADLSAAAASRATSISRRRSPPAHAARQVC